MYLKLPSSEKHAQVRQSRALDPVLHAHSMHRFTPSPHSYTGIEAPNTTELATSFDVGYSIPLQILAKDDRNRQGAN